MDAAYNLAKWLTRNPQDAEDVLQESFMKAFRHLDNFRGEDGRSWLLAIVRNTCYTWLKSKHQIPMDVFDDESHYSGSPPSFSDAFTANNPEHIVLKNLDSDLINQAIQQLPIQFREVLVLREQESFSYLEIACITGVPLGTVMSRLARARVMLRQLLIPHFTEDFGQ